MNTTGPDLSRILCLQGNEWIGKELADRQLEVISKSYQYLCVPGNNTLYLADEVGLGKTYIAAGIAMLFRHFSKDITQHRDLILVPKKNLQVKWRKDLNNFIQYNYKGSNDGIRSQFQRIEMIMEKLKPLRTEDPLSILRMSSFSFLALPKYNQLAAYDTLLEEGSDNEPFVLNTLEKALSLGYFSAGSENTLRKLIAYLLNILSPKINCLIIDEAHNYKYDPGAENECGSIRNEVTSRFLGARVDETILTQFPELRSRLKIPLAEKVICLSATPKDKHLLEIKNQLDCFTNDHILSAAQSIPEVKTAIKKFLIRGNLEYTIENKSVTRNQCRHEHRFGNVNKDVHPILLTVEDGFESLFWQLLQYKSIKHLNARNNASFEIGMLAGFESYLSDIQRNKEHFVTGENEEVGSDSKEYEQIAVQRIKESQDYEIIRGMVDSFRETFANEQLPHPKQTRLETEIVDQMKRQEKSLIFVRRVATAYELEKRLLDLYEKEIVAETQLKLQDEYARYHTPAVKDMVRQYHQRHIAERLDDVFASLMKRPSIKDLFFANQITSVEEARLWLETAFSADIAFNKGLEDFIIHKRKNISRKLKAIARQALEHSREELMSRLEEMKEDETGGEAEVDKTDNGYFFSNYFRKGAAGFKFRNKMYRENWYDLHILSLNQKFHFLLYEKDKLNQLLANSPADSNRKKKHVFQQTEESIRDFLRKNSVLTGDYGQREQAIMIEGEQSIMEQTEHLIMVQIDHPCKGR